MFYFYSLQIEPFEMVSHFLPIVSGSQSSVLNNRKLEFQLIFFGFAKASGRKSSSCSSLAGITEFRILFMCSFW